MSKTLSKKLLAKKYYRNRFTPDYGTVQFHSSLQTLFKIPSTLEPQ